MAVLISKMEIPSRCGECPCFHAEHPMYCQAVKPDKAKRIDAPYGKPRPDWCPLEKQPEQKHGHWIAENDFYDGDDYYICSVCGDTWFLECGNPEENNMHYCPCCGAKLDEEVKQE